MSWGIFAVDVTTDWRGRIDTLELNSAEKVTYEYIGSRVARRTYPLTGDDVVYRPTYDNLGRMTQGRTYKDTTDIAKFDYSFADDTDNIDKMTYDHRPEESNNAFSYDNLDRLTLATYGIEAGDPNEAFTIDDLGNRSNVNLKDGSDQSYSIDEVTNRYESIDSNALEYDAAGNLTEDKNGCQYEYDYENRLVRVRDANDVNVAEFTYDALSRRIEKKDLVDANNTRRYYYNYKWQVLCEYDDANDLRNYYIYGNYINEALIVQDASPNWQRNS